jgi:putative peptide zinc metalloprotease protein
MSGSLFSPLWYRIAALHPQMRPDVRVRRQQYRDQCWHLLTGTASGRTFRINEKAYQFVGRCDGRHTVQEIWDVLLAELGDDAPTQDEVTSVLNQLDENGLLTYEVVPDAGALADSGDARRKQRRKAFVNPFAMRVPLGNPSALLRRLDWLGPAIINPLALWIWVVAVAIGVTTAIVNWPELAAQAAANMGSPRFLLISWLCYPLIKLLHELGHGLAVRRWGGEVHEAGFSLLVLIPAPYVDASASAAFRNRRHRIVVGAIGIMVELAIAVIALAIWMNVQPGLIRDIALVIAFIASVSTLLFNGNPLLSFDGYYVFSDMIDVPNLRLRSQKFWNEAMMRFAQSSRTAQRPPRLARGEKKWLLLYAPLSLGYRIFISAVILLWVASQSLLLAAAASVFMLHTLLIKPAWAAFKQVRSAAPTHAARWRIGAISATIFAGLTAIVVALPLPHHTVARGIVWLPEQAQVRAGIDGFVRKVAAHDGDQVTSGDLLVVMEDPELIAQRARLESRLESLMVEQFDALLIDGAKARRFEEEIASARAELRRTEERLTQLELRAQVDGMLVVPRQQDLPNTYARQGSAIGYVLDHGDVGIRVAVPEYDALLVQQSTQEIEVRIADAPGISLKATLVREVPAATTQLPSAALGDRGGGSLATDPSDSDGLRVLEPVVLLDLQLPASHLTRVGARAWVRFDHGPTPLAMRWHRRAKQIFLKHISPERA